MHRAWPLIVVSVIYLFSIGGAYILFNILDSTANTDYKGFKLGGAIAGFIAIYYVLNRHYSKLSNPILTPNQTLYLLDYWSQSQAYKYQEWFFSALDRYKQNSNNDLFERIKIEPEAIREKSHWQLAEFETPLGNLCIYLESIFDREEFDKDMNKLLNMIHERDEASEIRYKVLKYIESRRKILLRKYRNDLKM